MTELWSDMARRTKPYKAGEQINTKDTIKLNTNENPYPPSPRVFEALQKVLTADLRKYPESDPEKLRNALGDYHNVSAKQVFVGNGSDEVLALSFMAFFTPGKSILFPSVTYSFYPTYAALFDIQYNEVPMGKDFTLNEEAFYQSAGGVIFPNPNAPTGIALPLQSVERIIQENPGRPIIVDEAYIDFGGESAISLLTRYDNVLITRTMSKSRSLAGLRIGYAIGSEMMIEALTRVKNSFNSYPIDRLALAAAEASLEDEVYFTETIQRIIDTRERFKKVFESIGFTVLHSSANFLFVHHSRVPAVQLYELLKEHHILVRHFPQPETEQWLRVTIGTDAEMEQLVQQLFKTVDAWTDKNPAY